MNLFDTIEGISPVVSDTFDQSNVSEEAIAVGERFTAVLVMLRREKNRVLQINNTARPLFMLASPTAITVLQSASMSEYGVGNLTQEDGNVYLDGLHVIINPYWNDAEPIRTVYINGQGNLFTAELHLKNIKFI